MLVSSLLKNHVYEDRYLFLENLLRFTKFEPVPVSAMGLTWSEEQKEQFYCKMFSMASEDGFIPDIGIDEALVKYSVLNSAAFLETSVSTLLSDMASKAPDYLQSLGAALAAFNCVPNAVGLGALVVALLLDLAITSVQSSDSPVDMVRRVFAEEKALGVRDTMEEYLKRLGMYLWDPPKALEETERLEKQLSEQLTRLKNSMLYDKQMNTRSMKFWTNGAAFHCQMLVHMARLKNPNRSEMQKCVASISTVVNLYLSDLKALLEKYQSFKRDSIILLHKIDPIYDALTVAIGDRECGRRTSRIYINGFKFNRPRSEEYVTYMFNNWSTIKKLNNYFTVLNENIETLVTQHDEFTIQNVLPITDSNSTNPAEQ